MLSVSTLWENDCVNSCFIFWTVGWNYDKSLVKIYTFEELHLRTYFQLINLARKHGIYFLSNKVALSSVSDDIEWNMHKYGSIWRISSTQLTNNFTNLCRMHWPSAARQRMKSKWMY